LKDNGQLGVHDSDLRWGLRYFDDIDPSSDDHNAALSTCYLQEIERELIRLAHLKPGTLIERQFASVTRSPDGGDGNAQR
jgi:hypothetical protein